MQTAAKVLLPSRSLLMLVIALWLSWPSTATADRASIRVAALKFGTLNWELNTIKEQGLDQAQGFDLHVIPLAGLSATRTALLSGSADVIVADWIWVNRQRQQGQALQFMPFSTAIGKVVLARDSAIRSLEDLRGKRLGIAGGAASKGWLLLQARAQQLGVDLKVETEQQFGAPPLLNAALEQGRIDAIVTFWHYAARFEAKGYPILTDLKSISAELGLRTDLPMLGFVFKQAWAEQYPQLVAGLHRASTDAKTYLQQQQAGWRSLRPMMKAGDDQVFEQLRLGYLAGIPGPIKTEQVDDAARMFALLYQVGGERLMGRAEHFDRAGFWGVDGDR
ncbi:ABC transporter substrate-binding protein [Motiliproteus coralliicola]|uniref:ABC transporter substrate-binding protein n=1 Tax=Motiliproteus coralliicola TaxID=2283196 RepID=A0A369WXH2_9GAMM|nr:ABC transporter substrate-binding protein [Motiliproteus coralliicola]RDE25224.1 ABC transporter substrate-binding protein [Motiliproteus coralliicola]